MVLSWITINSRLQTGVALMNSLTKTKFDLMLKRIVQSKTEEIFTQEELEKLRETLKLDEKNLELLILSIAHIWKQSSKVILKPTVLQEHLVDQLKLHQEKAEIFVNLWTNEIRKDFRLEQSKKINNISWELNVQSASSICSKEVRPNARIQFCLDAVDGSEKENLALELNEEELLHFYNVLESIQVKLDSL